MRNIWVAVIGVMTLTLLAGTSFATAPVAQDIPDIRLLTGSGTVEDFDLNDYVTDYDNDPTSLNWTIQGYTGFDGGANPASLAGSLLDIAGESAPTQGVVTYRVADASEFAEDSQVVKYSAFWLVGPSLTQDNNLLPTNDFPRTWVIEADRTLTTPAIASLLEGDVTPDLTVSIASLGGEWMAGDNVTDVTFGDLNASISAGGELVLKAPDGVYPLTGTELTGAYLVGVKAKVTGGGLAGANDNWDGMDLLVSTARLPMSQASVVPVTQAKMDLFNNFEGTVGALPTGAPVSLATGLGWSKSAGTGTAEIVASAPTTGTTAWASSGKALKVTLASTGQGAFVLSDWFTDVAPGETLTFQANVTSDAAAGARTGNVMLFVGNFHSLSNYEGVSWQDTSATLGQVPTGGADGWRTLKAKFKADTFGAATPITLGATETVNFYTRGYQAAMVFNYGPGQTAPVSFYVDNVRIFRDSDPLDAALAATVIDVTKVSPVGPFDGTLETETTIANAGWTLGTAEGTAQIDASGLNNMFTHAGTKALEVFVPAGITPAKSEVLFAKVELGANEGAGILGFTTWLKSNAPDPKSCPDIMVALTDPAFRNVPFAFTGYAGVPQADKGWKKISVSSAYTASLPRLWVLVIVKSGINLTARPEWGPLTGAERPGQESDAHIFFDDMKFHKVMDDVKYFDRSVFPATD